MGNIGDFSHHQPPNKINYDKLSKQLDLAIIRTQYGSLTIDTAYKTHYKEFQKRNVPTNSYAWVRGVNVRDMAVEATDFYNRTKEFNPYFWWLDVEEKSMSDMRSGISAYVYRLRELGVKNIGIYVANHLYKSFNLNLSEVNGIWIPSYGSNNGKPSRKPDYPCDLWQYTSLGRLDGYDGPLDLSQLNSDKDLNYFTGVEKAESKLATPKVYRLKTGTFKSKKDQDIAYDKLHKLTGWVLYKVNNDGYRLRTGSFKAKKDAQNAQKLIKDKLGWVSYIEEE